MFIEINKAIFIIHLFPISAKVALSNMKTSKKSQSIILMGESGAGKTFNGSRLINFFCPSSTTNDIGKRINAIDYILKLFGNSKTHQNDDSSFISKRIKVFIIYFLWLYQTIYSFILYFLDLLQ